MTGLAIISFLAAHFVGDWVFQSRRIAQEKSSYINTLLYHLCIVTVALSVPFLIFTSKNTIYLIVNALLHGLIDWNIWKWYKRRVPANFQYWKDKTFYNTIALDQFLHLTTIFLLFS